jgi:hypothetical protein
LCIQKNFIQLQSFYSQNPFSDFAGNQYGELNKKNAVEFLRRSMCRESYCHWAMEVSCPKKIEYWGCTYLLHRSPTDNSRQKDRLDYWIWLAKLAEKGKITSVFIADSYAGHNIYGGSADASYRGGSHIGKLDPLMTVSAMAGE